MKPVDRFIPKYPEPPGVLGTSYFNAFLGLGGTITFVPHSTFVGVISRHDDGISRSGPICVTEKQSPYLPVARPIV